jgi:hypothetical protein
LTELKDAYVKAIDADDDILTQFVEASDLKQMVEKAQTFAALVDVYRWMETDHFDYDGEDE